QKQTSNTIHTHNPNQIHYLKQHKNKTLRAEHHNPLLKKRDAETNQTRFNGPTQEPKTTATTTLYSTKTTTEQPNGKKHNSTELKRSTARTPRYNQNNNSRA